MMAKTHILAFLTYTLLQNVAGCDTADTCVAVRPCDNAKNIGSLDKKLDELQAALNSLKRQNADLRSKVTDIATQQRETTVQMTTLTWDLGNLTGEVGQKVGFSASLARGSNVHVGPAASQTIVFRNVFFNNGNAYNPATGMFTAPLKGAFQFTFTTFGYSAHYSGAQLLKNGHLQVSTWQSNGKHDSDSTSGAVILSLNAGDEVNLITWDWANNNMQVFDNVNHHTTFSGFLLFPL